MMCSWPQRRLGDLVKFKTGKLDSNAAVADGEYPFFTCSQETLRTNTFSFDTECVLLAGNNANGIYPLKYFQGKFDAYQRTYVLTPLDTDVLLTRYLYYALRPKLSEFRSFSTGAATKFLTMTILNATEISLPPRLVQLRIADMLSAYDDLIENCERRIRVLDEMASALYREWFVLFRYPGHEKTPLVDSALGKLPRGWRTERCDQIVRVHRGRAYRSTDLADEGGAPFVNLKCMDRDGGFRRSGIKRFVGAAPESHAVRPGDIVIAVTDMTQERRIVARAALIPTLDADFGVFSMDLVKVEPIRPFPAAWVFAYLRYSSFADHLKQHANGANVLHLSPDRIREHVAPVPPESLLEAFAQQVAPLYSMHDVLQNRVETLRKTRDLLLPRLLSGQLSVEDAA